MNEQVEECSLRTHLIQLESEKGWSSATLPTSGRTITPQSWIGVCSLKKDVPLIWCMDWLAFCRQQTPTLEDNSTFPSWSGETCSGAWKSWSCPRDKKRRNGVKVLGISLHTSRGGSLTPLCSGYIPIAFWAIGLSLWARSLAAKLELALFLAVAMQHSLPKESRPLPVLSSNGWCDIQTHLLLFLSSSVSESSRQCPTLDPRVASRRWECHSLKRATFLETNCLSMLCPTCSICWTQFFAGSYLYLAELWIFSNFMQCSSFYFLYSSATENQLHMSRGMVPCQVLRATTVVFGALLGQVHHRRLPPFKPIYITRCHNSQSVFSVPT